MSWFKRDSPLRTSFSRKFSSQKVDSTTCFEAFKGHWNQAWTIIEKNGHIYPGSAFSADNISAVLNNLDQMVTLLLKETSSFEGDANDWNSGPILDFVLTEGILDKLFAWSQASGEYMNVMKLEQLKIFEVLVSHSHHNLLFQKPIVRPLLQLLHECRECSPVDVEKRLIILLNTLCVSLTQHPELLEVFFSASSEQEPARFLIFSLLIPFIHREGSIGQQARDALLLCMALSRRNEHIGLFIAEHSNFCPVLATGLSGLYSVLPRKLVVVSEDWYHFTPEDIQDMPDLEMFLNSLEFCNAVIQVAHVSVGEQLLDYIYQGFLLPVLGPALNQISTNDQSFEVVATTAYLELSLRSVTEPSLIHLFLKFILTDVYEGVRILDTLVKRLALPTKLSLVTMSLFRTLLDLNCEDVMLELVLKYLIPCTHVMVSQRCRVRDLDIYCQTAEKILSLIPNCCSSDPSSEHYPPSNSSSFSSGFHSFDSPSSIDSLNGSLMLKRHSRSFYSGELSQLSESRETSYQNYLNSAHQMLLACNFACRCWSAPYDGIDPDGGFSRANSASRVSSVASNATGDLLDILEKPNGLLNVESNGVQINFNSARLIDRNQRLSSSPMVESPDSNESFGSMASSGVSDIEDKDSLMVSSNDHSLKTVLEDSGNTVNHNPRYRRFSSSTSLETIGTPDIGPFLSALLSRLELMMQNDVYTNLQLTGLITRLACYPQPLIRSFLLNHSLVFQPSVRSLIQILTTLKQKVDSYSNSNSNFESFLIKAKQFLAAREERLLKTGPPRVYAESHNRKPSGEFQRADNRRRSFTNFLFKRGSVASEPLVENMPNSQGYRYVSRPSPSCEGKIEYIKTRNAALCAIIFEEFLKELAAVTQEHAIIQSNPDLFKFEMGFFL